MPSNSGLYEDSDNESVMNELSPTDGYFNRRPSHLPDFLVPDPSQNTAESDKGREARKEAEDASALRITPQRTAQSASSRRSFNPTFEDGTYTEHSSLISSAPPAYSAATAGSTYQRPLPVDQRDIEVRGGGYNTMGRQEIFLPVGQPEDLGGRPYGAPDGSGEDSWAKRARRFIKVKYFVILIAVLIGIGFITTAILNMVDHGRTVPSTHRGSPAREELSDDAPESCPSGYHTSSMSCAFQHPTTFVFTQVVRNTHDSRYAEEMTYNQVRTSGEIHVRPTTEDLQDNVRVDIVMHFSESGMMRSMGWDSNTNSLLLYTPSHVSTDASSSTPPCTWSNVTIWIAAGAKFDAFLIETESFSVTIHDGLSFDSKAMKISTISNAVVFPSKQSTASVYNYRRVVITTVSGSVTGAFSLYDLLSISSVSGTINIDLEPKEAAEHASVPAQLHIETISSTVYVNTPAIVGADGASPYGVIPDRDYRTFVSSTSGSQYVNVIHGSETILHSVSGTIHANLSPYGSPSIKSNIDVVTKSASIEVTVLSSISHPGQGIKNLHGTYKRLSGSLKLRYPGEWEGEIEGTTLSGSLDIDWPGLRVIRDGRRGGSGYRVFEAIKGHGDGLLYFDGVSGSTELIGGALRSGRRPWDGRDEGSWREGWDDGYTPPIEGPDEPSVDLPDMGGPPPPAPPPRWPGYDDEWVIEG